MSRLGKTLFSLSGISLIAFMISRFVIGGFIPFLWIPVALFIGFLIGAIVVDRASYREFLLMKTTKHGMNMGAMILMVLVLLTTLNYLGVRHYQVWDFSAGSVNTLAEQSIQLVKSLDSELKVIFFYKDGVEGVQQQRTLFQNLIRKYQDQSQKVTLDFVEVNKRPDLAEQYGVNKGSGVVFLEYKGRKNRIEKIDEQEVTGALVKVTREKDKNIYVVVGHGEGGLEDSKEAYGLAAMKNLLEGNRYLVKPLMLAENPTIPNDVDVIIVPGARQSFLESEIKVLIEYVKRGGSLILAQEPNMPTGLDALVGPLGLAFSNDYIVAVMQTPMGPVADPSATPGTLFSDSNPITKIFSKNEFTLFRLPQGIKKVKAVDGISVDEIVRTAAESYAFKDTKFQGDSEKGPFALVDFVKGRYPGGENDFSMVVIGDGDILGNQFLYKNLNRDLLLNSIAALAKEENLISITPKEVKATEFKMTENDFYMFVWTMVIGLPLLLASTSGVLWYRRKSA